MRKRGSSYQVSVYAGLDPITGKRHYLTGSTSDAAEAESIRRRFVAQIDSDTNARTRASFGSALDAWLRTHDAEETTLDGYRGYVRRTIEPAIGHVPVGKVSSLVLEELYADLRRCRARCRDGEPAVDHRTSVAHECRTVRHRRRPGRPGPGAHDCKAAGCTVVECRVHRCRPMAASSILQIHWIISAALAAAVRWGWINSNPAEIARKPKQRAPQPDPPSPAEAARIVDAAWAEDDVWGALVWLVMVTGVRRGEVAALRWSDVDLNASKLFVRRSYVRSGRRGIEKDTKTHQMRRMSLDAATVGVLAELRESYDADVRALDVEPSESAFLFSYSPARDRPVDPSGITHRYARTCASAGVRSHLHALRHFSATELLAAGVDLRTVAGRLGHGGGGATTLRVYAAWVDDADGRAAEILGSRMRRPPRPG